MSASDQMAATTGGRAVALEPPPAARIHAFSPLGDRLGIAVATTPWPRDRRLSGWVVDDRGRQRVEAAHVAPRGDQALSCVVLRPAAGADPLRLGSVVLGADGRQVALDGSLRETLLEVDELAGRYLSGDGSHREAIVDRAIKLVLARPGADAAQAASLQALREAVRRPLPGCEVTPSVDCAFHVDGLWRIDEDAFYIEGWFLDRHESIRRLTVVTGEGRQVELLEQAHRYPRPDVSEFMGSRSREKLGFVSYFETPEPTLLDDGWLLQARRADGSGLEIALPAVRDSLDEARTLILNDLEHEALPAQALRSAHVRPALARLEHRRSSGVRVELIDQHGTPALQPDVTLVVPLYRRLDFLEHQLAQFVHDPEIAASDLVYVLDSPEDASRLVTLAEQLFRLYGVPFRVVALSDNGGFSVVNNVGASLARGRLLLLLNSDVLPAAPGWLSRLVAFHDAHPAAGAVAPKLLYEDDSIQHAGLYFDRPAGAHTWSNEHCFKGLHRSFPDANVARRVPAVTGACLMIATELYRSMGGLRGVYSQGDYEDSDLCLRLHEMGREIWYVPDVELYHLEGQSYPSPQRRLASDYNRWLHTHLWDSVIAGLGPGTGPGPTS